MTPTEPSASDADDALDLDPAAILATIERQQRDVDAAMMRGLPVIYLVWGAGYLVGYLMLWSAWAEGNPWFTVPVPVSASVFAAIVVAASVVSTVIGIRLGRGVSGRSDFPSTVYGISWPILGAAFVALGSAMIQHGLPAGLSSLYFTSVFSIMTGAMYLAGAAIWHSRGQLVLGVIMIAAGAVTPFAGTPLNLLLMALIGGGALLVTGVIAAARLWGRR